MPEPFYYVIYSFLSSALASFQNQTLIETPMKYVKLGLELMTNE